MNYSRIEEFFSQVITKEHLPIKLRIKASELSEIESTKQLIHSLLKKNLSFCETKIDSIDIKFEKSSSENKINFAERIIQILNQEQSDLKILYLVQNKELKDLEIKNLYEKIENQNLNKNYILILLACDDFEESHFLKNLCINLSFFNTEHCNQRNNCYEKSSNNSFLIEKNLIINSLLEKSKKLKTFNQRQFFLKTLYKIEEIFYKANTFNLNTNYIADYIRILLKNFH